MQIEFDEGTLLLCDAPDGIPYAEWDDRLDQYRAQAYRYRSLPDWAGAWNETGEQATLQDDPIQSIEDTARAYPDFELDKIRQADVENLVLAVSENLDCTSEDIDLEAERLLWFKTGIHVYDVIDLAEKHAVQTSPAGA